MRALRLLLPFWLVFLDLLQASNKEADEEAAINKQRSLKRNHTATRGQQPGTARTARTVRIDDEPEEMMNLEKAIEREANASLQPKDYPKADQSNFVGLRSKRLGPKPRPDNGVAGSQSSTFYPGGEKLLTDRDAQKERLSDPTDGMTEEDKREARRMIREKKQEIEAIKQKAGLGTPSKGFTSSAGKGFISSAGISPGGQTSRSYNINKQSQQKVPLQKTSVPMPNDIFNRPGVTVHHETIVDENQNKVILTTVVQDTPRGMKTSRFVSPVGVSSSMKSSSGMPISPVVTQSMVSMVKQSQHSQFRATDNNRATTIIKPKFTTDKGYPLLTTDEMPFPHVFQAQIAPWSEAPKSETNPTLAKSQGVPLKIDVSSATESGADTTESGSDSIDKKPTEETGGRISSRLVPDTFRRVAEFTGLRREQSGKGAKGFLESAKNSSAVSKDDELKEVIVDTDKKKAGGNAKGGKGGKAGKGKGEAGQDQSVEDDPAQDKITGDLDKSDDKNEGNDDGKKEKVDGEPKKKRKHHSHSKHSAEQKSENHGKHHRRHRHKKGGSEDEPSRRRKPRTSEGSEEDPSGNLHRVNSDDTATQNRAVIIDEHDESDSYEDDHMCKKLQPLLRYVEYEYVINTSTGFANVFALLMSLLSKLGAF